MPMRILSRLASAAAAAGMCWGSPAAAAQGAGEAPIATPPGITVQLLGKAQGYSMDAESASFLTRHQIGYADQHGMTLYTSTRDPEGKSVCTGDCTATWRPVLALPGVKPLGQWSIVTRADGGRQWALKGKPVYTYAKDTDIGAVGGNSPVAVARGPQVGPRGAYKGERPKEIPLPEGWSPALVFPVTDIPLPPGFAVKEIPEALGVVLLGHDGRMLYAFDADPDTDRRACVAAASCGNWQPLAAPQLAMPVADFGFVMRRDGVRQWTYKGKGLYTHARDLVGGDYANGVGVDPAWRPAYVVRYYMPPGVRVTESKLLGKVLATDSGRTLYVRNAFIVQSGGGHGTRRGISWRPAVGRDLGANPRCRQACERWRPYLAAAGDLPQGYWHIVERPDGARQWAYNGFALWMFDGDTAPGDILGQDTWDFFFSDNPDEMIDVGTQYDGATGLYWTVAIP